jgi:hypothetical protein
LFVAIGPAEGSSPGKEQQPRGREAGGTTTTTTTVTESVSGSGSPDEGDSVLSAAGSHASAASVRAQGVALMRKEAEELARMLDGKLGSLRIPDEGVMGAD